MDKGMMLRAGHAEEIAELAGSDEQGRPGGKAHHHGMGNEIDERAEPRKPQRELEHAGDERERQDHL